MIEGQRDPRRVPEEMIDMIANQYGLGPLADPTRPQPLVGTVASRRSMNRGTDRTVYASARPGPVRRLVARLRRHG